MKGTVTNERGADLYGAVARFDPDDYLGMLLPGDVIERLEAAPVRAPGGERMVQVQVRTSVAPEYRNLIAWIAIASTDLEKAAPAAAPERPIRGTVSGPHGDAIYGDESGFNPANYIGRLFHGDEIEVVDPRTVRNEFGFRMVQVRVLRSRHGYNGRIVWIGLKQTDLGPQLESEPEWIAP